MIFITVCFYVLQFLKQFIFPSIGDAVPFQTNNNAQLVIEIAYKYLKLHYLFYLAINKEITIDFKKIYLSILNV